MPVFTRFILCKVNCKKKNNKKGAPEKKIKKRAPNLILGFLI
jgi:hypothetical protein